MTLTRRNALGLAAAGAAFAIGGCGPGGNRGGKAADVIVLGAGLSGLHAALTLQGAGMDVLVLEASERIGGRMRTLDDLPGAPEAGGAQVGRSYARVHARAMEFGLQMGEFAPSTFGQVLSVRDQLLSAEDWPSAAVNTLPEPFRALPPSRLFFSLIARNNPLPDVYAWREAQWAEHDRAAADYLHDVIGAPDEALRLMDVSLNAESLSTYSMMNIWRTLAIYSQDRELGPSQRILGGSQRLPEAMAGALIRPVRTGARAVVLDTGSTGAAVRLASGETLRADFIVCALPFSVLRTLDLIGEAPVAQRDAIEGLNYTPIVQLHLEAETPWWETDGLAPDMWTDSALERIFIQRGADGSPTGMLTCWIDGIGGLEADRMDDEALQALASRTMARIRPASSGRVRLRQAVRWTPSNPLAGGAYMHWRPGQIGRWAETMVQPFGRVHIAGEHASHLHTGMEGAMEAGERAAIEILERADA
ncbi:MAG: NAD(P)/FAD-dependent oxidoreductase [Pseudomonadota bacterium]